MQPCLTAILASAVLPEFAPARPAALTSCGVRGKMSRPTRAHDCHHRCSSRQAHVGGALHLKQPDRYWCGTPTHFSRNRRRSVTVPGAITRHGCESVITEEHRCNRPRTPCFDTLVVRVCMQLGAAAVSLGNEFAHQSTRFCVPPQPRPNPSFEARPNGKPPGPAAGLAYHPAAGPGVLPSVPPQLER